MSGSYDIAALRAATGPIKWEDNPILVKQKSRDFFWYSPVLKRERAAVANQDGPLKAALNRHVGDDLERARSGIGAFVDVKVKLPASALREIEEDAEPLKQIRRHAGDGAENPGPMSIEHLFDVGHV